MTHYHHLAFAFLYICIIRTLTGMETFATITQLINSSFKKHGWENRTQYVENCLKNNPLLHSQEQMEAFAKLLSQSEIELSDELWKITMLHNEFLYKYIEDKYKILYENNADGKKTTEWYMGTNHVIQEIATQWAKPDYGRIARLLQFYYYTQYMGKNIVDMGKNIVVTPRITFEALYTEQPEIAKNMYILYMFYVSYSQEVIDLLMHKVEAIGKGQTPLIKKFFLFLETNAINLNICDSRLHTLLHLAALREINQPNPTNSLTAYLLTHGVTTNSTNEKGETPLAKIIDAIDKRNIDPIDAHLGIIELLLKYNADIYAYDIDKNNALHKATQSLQYKILEQLLRYAHTLDTLNKEQKTPLMIAIENKSKYDAIDAEALKNESNNLNLQMSNLNPSENNQSRPMRDMKEVKKDAEEKQIILYRLDEIKSLLKRKQTAEEIITLLSSHNKKV